MKYFYAEYELLRIPKTSAFQNTPGTINHIVVNLYKTLFIYQKKYELDEALRFILPKYNINAHFFTLELVATFISIYMIYYQLYSIKPNLIYYSNILNISRS